MCVINFYKTKHIICRTYFSFRYYVPSIYSEFLNLNTILKNDELVQEYNFPDSIIKIILVVRHLNGSFVDVLDAKKSGHLQFCKNNYHYMDAAFVFGTYYQQKCNITVESLYDSKIYPPHYYEAFLEHVKEGKKLMINIPVFIKGLKEPVRRFLLVDNVVGYQSDQIHHVLYAEKIQLVVHLKNFTHGGQIYPPYLKIKYATVKKKDIGKDVMVFFWVTPTMNVENIKKNIWIALGVLSSLGFLLVLLETWTWNNRNGVKGINFNTIITFFFISFNYLANIIFCILFLSSIWVFIFYKWQTNVIFLFNDDLKNDQFLGLIICGCLMKALYILRLFFSQINLDFFLVDWETSNNLQSIKVPYEFSIPPSIKNSSNNSRQLPPLRLSSKTKNELLQPQPTNPSVWRMYLVANEWNEIQSLRKLSFLIQLFSIIFFLDILGLGNLASMDPKSSIKSPSFPGYQDDSTYSAPHSWFLRFSLIGSVYLLTALCQILCLVLFYERFIEDKIGQFVDLCSMCNISLFIFDSEYHGYYIHGRSVHGHSDVDLKTMHENFSKEEKDVVSMRGLVMDEEHQTFEIFVNRKLRANIDHIIKPLLEDNQNYTENRKRFSIDKESDKLIEAHYVMNKMLKAYIDHILEDVDYVVKKKSLVETMGNFEIQNQKLVGTFYYDNGHSFDKCLFYGNELSFIILEIFLLVCSDIIFQNFTMDCIMTFIIVKIIIIARDSFGRKNLAKKTMVDNRFLI